MTFRLHLADGQSYLQLLLLTVITAMELERAQPGWISPVAAAALVLMRPTHALAIGALFLLGYRVFARRTTFVFTLLGAASLSLTGVHVWKDYAQMIVEQSEDHLQRAIGVGKPPSPDASKTMAAGIRIEGIDNRSFIRLNGFERDRSFIGLFAFDWLRKQIARFPWFNQSKLRVTNLALALLCAASGLWVASRLQSSHDALMKLTFAFLLPIDVETFGPLRIAYSDVLLALPFMLIATSITVDLIQKHGSCSRRLSAFLLGVVCFVAISRVHPGVPAGILSVSRFFALLVAANLFCIYRGLKRTELSPELLANSWDAQWS